MKPPPGTTPRTRFFSDNSNLYEYMAQTSVHLKACDIAASEIHNKREKELDYVRKDLTHLNESFSYIPHSLQTELAEIRRAVKDKTGRKLQKNAVPVKEGVIVIDGKTTMADLQRYCEECRNKFGIVPLQIHVHRDEGHSKAKEWKPNLHAHIVWSMYDENGRNVRLSKQDCRDMQTIAASVLGMQRGRSSDKRHLDALRYKIEQQEKRIEELESKLSETQERLKGVYEGTKQGVSDLFTGRARKRAEEAEKSASEAKKREEAVRAKAKEAIANAKADAKNAEDKAERIRRELDRHRQELKEIEAYKQRAATAEKKLDDLKSKLGWRERMIEKFIEFGAVLSEQWNRLFKGETVQTDHIRMKGVQVPLDNPIEIKLDKENHLLVHDQQWITEQGFWNGIRKGLTNAFNQGSEAYSLVTKQIGGDGRRR